MCNFLGHRVTRFEFIKLKQIEKELGTLAALDALKDGFRYGESPIIKAKGENDIEIINAHWEFIPIWIKDITALQAARKQGIPWLNAKSETLLESKMFRDAALKRRCLVLASHFFEWRHYKPAGAKKDTAYPYLVQSKEQKPLYFAGIWQQWTDRSTGETLDTFAIVTTAANDLMKQVHNKKERMPAMLTEDLAHEWIFGNLTENRIKEIAAFQIPSEELEAYTIRKDFKAVADPLEAFTYEELPAL
jgi:putative SOS response-associated peptidase YedK